MFAQTAAMLLHLFFPCALRHNLFFDCFCRRQFFGGFYGDDRIFLRRCIAHLFQDRLGRAVFDFLTAAMLRHRNLMACLFIHKFAGMASAGAAIE